MKHKSKIARGLPPPHSMTHEEAQEALQEGRETAAALGEQLKDMEGLPDPHIEADRQRHRAESAERERDRMRAVVEAARRCIGYGPHHIASYGLAAWDELRRALAEYDREGSGGE